MDIRNPGLIVDGKVNWQMYEDLLVANRSKYMGEIFSLDEMKYIFAKENIHEYYKALGRALDRRT